MSKKVITCYLLMKLHLVSRFVKFFRGGSKSGFETRNHPAGRAYLSVNSFIIIVLLWFGQKILTDKYYKTIYGLVRKSEMSALPAGYYAFQIWIWLNYLTRAVACGSGPWVWGGVPVRTGRAGRLLPCHRVKPDLTHLTPGTLGLVPWLTGWNQKWISVEASLVHF